MLISDNLSLAMHATADTDTKGVVVVDECRHIKGWSPAFDLEISLPNV